MKILVTLASISSGLLLATGGVMFARTVNARPIVNPTEQMVVLPAFKQLGPSRISTVRFCEAEVKPYSKLVTDSDFHYFETCLIEQT
jgi:hypothetical protein